MKTRRLGNLEVSAIGFGCMGMTHAYGAPADEKEMLRLMDQAIDLGCTFYDTAECYTGQNADGTTAYNEELVGKALKPHRHEVVLASKFGVRHTPDGLAKDSRPETIRRSIEGSLRRLQTDYLDLYYQHRVDPKVPIEDVAGVMSDLMREGKILHWGISEATEEVIRKAHAVCPLTAIQNRYSMLARQYEPLFPVLKELNIGFVAFSPLGNGFLSACYNKGEEFTDTADYRRRMPQFTAEGFDTNKPLTDLISEMATSKGVTPALIALAWTMAKEDFIVPIPGTRKPQRLAENLEAANVELTAEEMRAFDKLLCKHSFTVFNGSKK